MAGSLFPDSPYEIRADLLNAHAASLSSIANPGTWLTGEKRTQIAEEVRHARHCAACAELKDTLSPNNLSQPHASLGNLSPAEVDIVHRVTTDPGRLSEGWCRAHIDDGISEGAFVETVGVIAMTMIMDTFAFGLGQPATQLDDPVDGEPSRYLPPGARREAAWVPIVEPGDEVPEDGPLYPSPTAGYIHRTLSMVPDSKRDYWNLAGAHYLEGKKVYDFGDSGRAITRPQIEVIAARISALHQCLY